MCFFVLLLISSSPPVSSGTSTFGTSSTSSSLILSMRTFIREVLTILTSTTGKMLVEMSQKVSASGNSDNEY